MFVDFGGQKLFFELFWKRQMAHLKEKYFSVILRKE